MLLAVGSWQRSGNYRNNIKHINIINLRIKVGLCGSNNKHWARLTQAHSSKQVGALPAGRRTLRKQPSKQKRTLCASIPASSAPLGRRSSQLPRRTFCSSHSFLCMLISVLSQSYCLIGSVLFRCVCVCVSCLPQLISSHFSLYLSCCCCFVVAEFCCFFHADFCCLLNTPARATLRATGCCLR